MVRLLAVFAIALVGCGGKTDGGAAHSDSAEGGPVEGDASVAPSTPEAAPPASSGRDDAVAPSPPDAASTFADAAGSSRDAGAADAPAVDGRATDATADITVDGAVDICWELPFHRCEGETLVQCWNNQTDSIDCGTAFGLPVSPPITATCAEIAGDSMCAALPGTPCFAIRLDEPLIFNCIGVDAACVILPADESVCVEGVGPCRENGACFGRYRQWHCQNGQPLLADCAAHHSSSTCAGDISSGTYCANVGIGGECDSDANGLSDVAQAQVRCAAGLICLGAFREPSGVVYGTCLPPATSCDDGVQNGSETDVDCGGLPCLVPSDVLCCSDDDCSGGRCIAKRCAFPTSCGDAGASSELCPRCFPGRRCSTDQDCMAGACAGTFCLAAACTDAILGGSESDVDCGGACPGCGVGEHCCSALDCQSRVCDNDVCVGP